MIRTGQVILVSTTGWFGRGVQVVTGSAFNHSGLMINELECMSAEPGGARIRLISEYKNDVVAYSQFDLTDKQRAQITGWASDHLGTPYDHLGFAAIAVTKILGRFAPRWLLRYIGTHDRMICSYLVDLALQAGDIHLFRDHRPEGAVTPGSFGRIFHARGWADRS